MQITRTSFEPESSERRSVADDATLGQAQRPVADFDQLLLVRDQERSSIDVLPGQITHILCA